MTSAACKPIWCEAHDDGGGLWGSVSMCSVHGGPVADCNEKLLREKIDGLAILLQEAVDDRENEALSWVIAARLLLKDIK